MIDQILQEWKQGSAEIRRLREISPYWPEFIAEDKKPQYLVGREYYPYKNDHEYILSTIVRIERDGIWYDVHCVNRGLVILDQPVSLMLNDLFRQFTMNVYTVQNLYKIDPNNLYGSTCVSKIQVPEQQRLMEGFYSRLL